MRKLGGYYRTISTCDLGQDGGRTSLRIKCRRCGKIYEAIQFWFPEMSWWVARNKWKTPHCPKCRHPFIISAA